MEDGPLLAFQNVSKEFGGTKALTDVSIDLHKGEILALLGENGAGKSTLIKTLAGIYKPDGGQILFRGQPYNHRPPKPNTRQSVAFIHQDLGLIEWMTVSENVGLA
jgi:ribose transport system ATP-binding protein